MLNNMTIFDAMLLLQCSRADVSLATKFGVLTATGTLDYYALRQSPSFTFWDLHRASTFWNFSAPEMRQASDAYDSAADEMAAGLDFFLQLPVLELQRFVQSHQKEVGSACVRERFCRLFVRSLLRVNIGVHLIGLWETEKRKLLSLEERILVEDYSTLRVFDRERESVEAGCSGNCCIVSTKRKLRLLILPKLISLIKESQALHDVRIFEPGSPNLEGSNTKRLFSPIA